MIAVDSSSFIAFLKRDEGRDLPLIREALRNSKLVFPAPVLSEILSDPKLPLSHSLFISEVPLLDPLPGFWERAGKLRAKIIAKKLRARMVDAVIAQSCIDHDVPLITRDKDFQHFKKYGALKLY